MGENSLSLGYPQPAAVVAETSAVNGSDGGISSETDVCCRSFGARGFFSEETSLARESLLTSLARASLLTGFLDRESVVGKAPVSSSGNGSATASPSATSGNGTASPSTSTSTSTDGLLHRHEIWSESQRRRQNQI